MTTPDTGYAATAAPLAAPAHFFEVGFDAPAATTYQVWLRLSAAADSKWNDSVWLQFNDAVDALVRSGSDPANRVGEVKARKEVFRYVYDRQFLPSIPPLGFEDGLNQ